MKSYGILLGLLAIILLCSASASYAVFPNVRSGLDNGVGDTACKFKLLQGWWENELAWYINLETNNIRTAQSLNLTLTPKLSSAAISGAAPIYIVTNFNQGPIFSARPGEDTYSGLWLANYITWAPGVQPRPITNANPAGPDNPNGIPVDGSVCISFFPPCVPPGLGPTVLDFPIVALGELDGPWRLSSEWNTVSFPYRLLQVVDYDPRCKTITLPAWYVYCDDPFTRLVVYEKVIIPDASDPVLAALLKANLAPALLQVPPEDTQAFYWQLFPKPPAQFPVIEECPVFFDWRNPNFQLPSKPSIYSPVMRVILLQRNIPPSTVVNNDTFIFRLINSGGLIVTSDTLRINAPVICCKKAQNEVIR